MLERETNYSKRRLMRIMVVMIVYQYELSNEKINSNEIFEQDLFNDLFDYQPFKDHNKIQKEQMKIISTIEKNYDLFKSLIIKYIRQDWSWNRILPLTRSILLCACVELWKLDLPIVANEYVEIAKDLIPDDETFKFINIIIENIGQEYNAIKKERN